MKKNHLLRVVSILLCALLVVCCSGSLLVTIYTSDVMAVARQDGTILYTNATVIASGLQEEKDIEFLRNNLNSFSNDRVVKQDYGEALSFTIKIPVVNENYQESFDSSKDLLFLYTHEEGQQVDMYCKYNDELVATISDYLQTEHFQAFDWNELALSIRLENDLQDAVSVLAYSSFVNGEPFPLTATIDLKRRDAIEIVFSDVLRNAIVKGNKQKVASIRK